MPDVTSDSNMQSTLFFVDPITLPALLDDCFMPNTSNIFHPCHFSSSQTFSLKKKKKKASIRLRLPPHSPTEPTVYLYVRSNDPLAETHKPLIQSKVCPSTNARTSFILTLQALSVSSFCSVTSTHQHLWWSLQFTTELSQLSC